MIGGASAGGRQVRPKKSQLRGLDDDHHHYHDFAYERFDESVHGHDDPRFSDQFDPDNLKSEE